MYKYGCTCCAFHEYIGMVHVLLWLTNDGNDEMMIIPGSFHEVIWMQDSKCMKTVVIIHWLPECFVEGKSGTSDIIVKQRVSKSSFKLHKWCDCTLPY